MGGVGLGTGTVTPAGASGWGISLTTGLGALAGELGWTASADSTACTFGSGSRAPEDTAGLSDL